MRYRASIDAVALRVAACGYDNSTSPTPTPTPTPTSQRYTLSGTITDKDTAAPLSAATIAVTDGPNQGRSATTDSGGRYTFADLQSSRFTIRVTRDGYAATTDSVMLNANIMVNVALD